MANHAPKEKKLDALMALSEGLGISSVVRLTGLHKQTVWTLQLRAAQAARSLMRDKFRRLHIDHFEVDELWTFIQRRGAYCPELSKGTVWIYVALDPVTKLVPCYLVGKRDTFSAERFMGMLKATLSKDTRISTDALASYVRAMARINEPKDRRENMLHLAHARILGDGRRGHTNHVATTNHVESHNNTLRNHISRLRRRGRGFSKSREGLETALDLYFFYYNFCKVHLSIGQTPAMRAGLAAFRWDWEMLLRREGEPRFRARGRPRKKPQGPEPLRILEVA